MDWGSLFFKFSGRINRAKYWLAALIYVVIYLVLAAVGYATDQSVAHQGIKRLHDRNKSGWYLLLFYIVPGILVTAAAVMYVTMDDATLTSAVLGLAAFAVGVWAFVELGCLRGTVGANRYGPDPIATVTAPPVRTPV